MAINTFPLIAVEIKAGKTISDHFFKELLFLNQLHEDLAMYLIYGGDNSQKRKNIKIVSWKDVKL